MKNNQKMYRTNIYLSFKQHAKIKALAKEKGVTFSEMFRRIIDMYFDIVFGEDR